MGGRAQVSMEYLLVAGFAFLLLTPIIIIAYTQSARFTTDVSAAQIQRVGEEIVQSADAVYYAGAPSRQTLSLYFPKNIQAIDITDNRIRFTMQGDTTTYEYVLYAQTNLTGSIGTFSGVHNIKIEALTNEVNISES